MPHTVKCVIYVFSLLTDASEEVGTLAFASKSAFLSLQACS